MIQIDLNVRTLVIIDNKPFILPRCLSFESKSWVAQCWITTLSINLEQLDPRERMGRNFAPIQILPITKSRLSIDEVSTVNK